MYIRNCLIRLIRTSSNTYIIESIVKTEDNKERIAEKSEFDKVCINYEEYTEDALEITAARAFTTRDGYFLLLTPKYFEKMKSNYKSLYTNTNHR
jgi:hypothetical protein